MPQNLIGFPGCQTEGMEQFPGRRELRDQGTGIRGSAQAGQKREQLVTGVPVFNQRIAQRLMPDPVLPVAGGIGGQERKREVLLPAFHKMKENALGNPQVLKLFRKIQGYGLVVRRDFMAEYLCHMLKGGLQPFFSDVFRTDAEGQGIQQPGDHLGCGLHFRLFPADLQSGHPRQFPDKSLTQRMQPVECGVFLRVRWRESQVIDSLPGRCAVKLFVLFRLRRGRKIRFKAV